MQLSQEERDLLGGKYGAALASVFEEQVRVGEFFGAERFVQVANAHFMGDPEVFGEAGLDYLGELVEARVRTRVPTTRNASCVDLEHAEFLRQDPQLVADELKVRQLLSRLGVAVTNTCVGYQTMYQPVRGEHVAWGDTGTVAYANSVLGARTNYESGSASLAAGLTGRTPAYGYHLDEHRRANVRVRVQATLRDYADWGALGGLVGERARGYWNVPVFELAGQAPSSDLLKHLGASLASFGSMAMFHVAGITPEACSVDSAIGGRTLIDEFTVGDDDIEAYFNRDQLDGDVDLVVFTAPQLSLFEMQRIAALLEGRKVAERVRLLLTTNSTNLLAAEEQGYADVIRQAGGHILKGTCWYIMDPVAQRKQFGWKSLVTNSAKLVNIIRAHGYQPALRRTDRCIEAALTGRLAS